MQRLFGYMLTSLDRVGRRSSNLALYFGLTPVREQKFEQFELPRRERGQRSPFEDFVDALQRVLAPLVLGAGSAAPFLQRRVHLENCGPKPVESRLHTFGHCLSSGISGLQPV